MAAFSDCCPLLGCGKPEAGAVIQVKGLLVLDRYYEIWLLVAIDVLRVQFYGRQVFTLAEEIRAKYDAMPLCYRHQVAALW